VSHLYRGESRFYFGFRVGPQTNKLVEVKGQGKREANGPENRLGQGKEFCPRAEEMFQKVSNFLVFRFK
jgi:hypothetical protein